MCTVNVPSLPAQRCLLMLEMSGSENIPRCPHMVVHLIESSHDPLSSGYAYDSVPLGRAMMECDTCPKPRHLNKSTVTSSTAEPVLNAPMLSATTQSKPCPKPHHLNTSGGASSAAEPVPNTLQPSMSTLATQPRPRPQKRRSLNQSGVPSTNPVDGTACDSMDHVSDDFFIGSHGC